MDLVPEQVKLEKHGLQGVHLIPDVAKYCRNTT